MKYSTSKKRQSADETQVSLFEWQQPEQPPSPGSLNIGIRLRQSVANAIRKSGKEPIDLCAEIYKLTGIEVSIHTLYSWSAPSRDRSCEGVDNNGNKRWGIPAEIVPAFCQVCGDWETLFIVNEAGHYKALKGKGIAWAQAGRLKEEIAKKSKQLKDLEKKLLEAEK